MPPGERIVGVDALRRVAVLGVLLVSMLWFAGPEIYLRPVGIEWWADPLDRAVRFLIRRVDEHASLLRRVVLWGFVPGGPANLVYAWARLRGVATVDGSLASFVGSPAHTLGAPLLALGCVGALTLRLHGSAEPLVAPALPLRAGGVGLALPDLWALGALPDEGGDEGHLSTDTEPTGGFSSRGSGRPTPEVPSRDHGKRCVLLPSGHPSPETPVIAMY